MTPEGTAFLKNKTIERLTTKNYYNYLGVVGCDAIVGLNERADQKDVF